MWQPVLPPGSTHFASGSCLRLEKVTVSHAQRDSIGKRSTAPPSECPVQMMRSGARPPLSFFKTWAARSKKLLRMI